MLDSKAGCSYGAEAGRPQPTGPRLQLRGTSVTRPNGCHDCRGLPASSLTLALEKLLDVLLQVRKEQVVGPHLRQAPFQRRVADGLALQFAVPAVEIDLQRRRIH